jgi:RNA polymerase sigma-70 factor, ECF subfamily
MSAVAATVCRTTTYMWVGARTVSTWADRVDVPAATAQLARLAPVTDVGNLVELCQRGDSAAFQELFRRHRADVARLVHRMLGPTAELEDVIQEVFLQVHRSIKDFKGNSLFSTWLYRVTVNVVLMHRRAARSRPIFADASAVEAPADARPLPDEQVARLARIRAFYRVLERLSPKKRAVFVLHELEGLPPAEIAKVVGAPVLTVRTRLFYARRELAEMLREEPVLAAIAREIISSADSSVPERGKERR